MTEGGKLKSIIIPLRNGVTVCLYRMYHLCLARVTALPRVFPLVFNKNAVPSPGVWRKIRWNHKTPSLIRTRLYALYSKTSAMARWAKYLLSSITQAATSLDLHSKPLH